MAIEVIRALMLATHETGVTKIAVTVCEEVANYLNNKKRRELAKIEDLAGLTVQIYSQEGVTPDVSVQCGAGKAGGHQPGPFIMYITMSNRSAIGAPALGTDKDCRHFPRPLSR